MITQIKDISTRTANEQAAEIRDREDLEDILDGQRKEYDTLFVRDAARFMERAGITRQKIAIIVSPVMSPGHLYNLLNGNRRPNKREHVIAIGLALGLSVHELSILLKDSGERGLDAKRSPGDTVVIYGISNKKDLYEINDILHEVGAEYVLYDMKASL